MDEKIMVSDTLTQINSSLEQCSQMITQTANKDLRDKMIQMRNAAETSQYELFQIAKQHGYYEPAAPATPEDISKVKSIFTEEHFSYR